MEKSKRRSLAALVVATILLGACSGDDDEGDPSLITDPVETTDSTSSTSSSTSTTEDPQAAVEAEVEAAYLAYVDAFVEIFANPNPNNPLIERHTTGASREKTLAAISDDIINGTSLRMPESEENFQATVLDVSVDGDTAAARICFIDGGVLIRTKTGEVLNDILVTLEIDAVLVREEGVWKLSEHETIERHEGRAPCDR